MVVGVVGAAAAVLVVAVVVLVLVLLVVAVAVAVAVVVVVIVVVVVVVGMYHTMNMYRTMYTMAVHGGVLWFTGSLLVSLSRLAFLGASI